MFLLSKLFINLASCFLQYFGIFPTVHGRGELLSLQITDLKWLWIIVLFLFFGFLYLIRIDVTEVQIFIIIMHLLAVIGGPPFWQSLVILFMFYPFLFYEDYPRTVAWFNLWEDSLSFPPKWKYLILDTVITVNSGFTRAGKSSYYFVFAARNQTLHKIICVISEVQLFFWLKFDCISCSEPDQWWRSN